MDQPLANLDAQARVQMRELRRLQKRLGTRTVYVTHDQQDAMTLGGPCRGHAGRQWMALAPPALLREHLHPGAALTRALTTTKRPVVDRGPGAAGATGTSAE